MGPPRAVYPSEPRPQRQGLGNGAKDKVMHEFTKEAAARGASRPRITQAGGLTYGFILPRLSFFIHPAQTTVERDIEVQQGATFGTL